MGMGFSNRRGDGFSCNRAAWALIVGLALDSGWEPNGTLGPNYLHDEEIWDPNNYFSNCGQGVQESDAFELANALERAILKLKGEEIEVELIPDELPFGEYFEADERISVSDIEDEMLIREPFLDENEVKIVQDFMKFCRGGEFCIC